MSIRFVRQATDGNLFVFVQNLCGASGLRHRTSAAVRRRAAFLLLKALEAIEGRSTGSIAAFVPLVLSFEGKFICIQYTLYAVYVFYFFSFLFH